MTDNIANAAKGAAESSSASSNSAVVRFMQSGSARLLRAAAFGLAFGFFLNHSLDRIQMLSGQIAAYNLANEDTRIAQVDNALPEPSYERKREIDRLKKMISDSQKTKQ
eukprot:GILI01019683.1.p1 GENE.GILI01019683.1~~GILI01019683.1.p1  ORF type:complete len:124 (-),score=15.50 GILI01019683.1:127-453(-)